MQGTNQISRCLFNDGYTSYYPYLAAQFKEAELKDIVVHSMVVAEGPIDSMFSGTRSYNRALRIYKILHEAFLRIFQNEFEVENPEVTNAVHQRLANIEDPFDSEQILASPELQQYTTQFIVFKDALWEASDLTTFWKSFLDMVKILFNLPYSTRVGKWNLYIKAVRNSLPWFFTYD